MALVVDGGGLINKGGALGTGAACCCGKGCGGAACLSVQGGEVVTLNCVDGCTCRPHPCNCPFDQSSPQTYCNNDCAPYPEKELVAFAVCMDAITEQAESLRGALESWVSATRTWMQEHGYANTTFSSVRCPALEQTGEDENLPSTQYVMISVWGCCTNGFDLTGDCLNLYDTEPDIDRPYTATVYHNTSYSGTYWDQVADCDTGRGYTGRVIPPCAENPLP